MSRLVFRLHTISGGLFVAALWRIQDMLPVATPTDERSPERQHLILAEPRYNV
jgi:hypothetical protein